MLATLVPARLRLVNIERYRATREYRVTFGKEKDGKKEKEREIEKREEEREGEGEITITLAT